ncbi:hypothetical protein HAX39_25650 [Citrobacter freundii]|nr:hypothetical protein [Citrobacter freundii]
MYDNQVVVPPQMEDFSQPPGGSIWHMPYYLRGPKDSLDGVNVYIRKSADDKSSLNEPLMTIECSHWSFSKDNFELKIDTTTNKFAEFNYKTDGSNDFYEIFNMRFWLNQADCVSPRTNKSASSEDELMNNHYKPFQLRENWFVLSAYQRSAGDYSMTLTVDRNVIGYKPPESYNISSEQVPAVRDGKWINVDYLKLLNWTIVNENQLEPFNGNALLMWQPINADCYYSSGDYLNDLDVYLQNIGGRYVVDIKCRDSFGQNIVAQINLGGDHDCYPDSWSLYGVSQL